MPVEMFQNGVLSASPSFHGLSEMLYEYTSSAANNGSGFEGLDVCKRQVLLTGETGTGKEVFAQAIHHASRRAKGAFVAINCSAFSRELLESELFGHRAGSFTGAAKDKKEMCIRDSP